MIAYTEKGIGLHKAIAAAEQSLWCVDGVWHSSDDAVVQAIIDGYTLDDAKRARCAETAAFAARLRDGIVANISPAEMSSWPLKTAEATAYEGTQSADSAPMLSMEAQARGVSLATLVAKVNANSAALSYLEAQIAGIDGKHRDAITALGSFDEVGTYDFSTGWPDVVA